MQAGTCRASQGKTYLEIQAAGGGILSTVHATRSGSLEKMVEDTRRRLWNMFINGTTTAEVKTGYGLRMSAELRMLQALMALDRQGPLDIVPTFLGAHTIAPEFRENPEGYTELITETMLPVLCEWWPHFAPFHPMPFVDVFCETGEFDLEQSRRILSKARDLGFPLKIHADEFDNLGGVPLAVELGAASADHLVATSLQDIAEDSNHSAAHYVASSTARAGDLPRVHVAPSSRVVKQHLCEGV